MKKFIMILAHLSLQRIDAKSMRMPEQQIYKEPSPEYLEKKALITEQSPKVDAAAQLMENAVAKIDQDIAMIQAAHDQEIQRLQQLKAQYQQQLQEDPNHPKLGDWIEGMNKAIAEQERLKTKYLTTSLEQKAKLTTPKKTKAEILAAQEAQAAAEQDAQQEQPAQPVEPQ